MSPRHSLLILALASLVAAVPADGREAVLGVEQSLTGDSNLFNTNVNGDATADASYRIGPTLRLVEDRDVLNYRFYYAPKYQVYFTTDDVNGWSQILTGELEYTPGARDVITLSTRVLKQSSVQLLDGTTSDATAASVPGIGDTGRYSVDLGYEHSFTERLSGEVSAGYEQWTYSNPRSIPNISGIGEMSGRYVFSPQIQGGVSASGRYRSFEEVGPRPESSNVVANVSLFANWAVDQHWSMEVSGGPTYVAQRQDAPAARIVDRFSAFEFGSDLLAAQFANCVPTAGGDLLLSACGFDPADPSNGLIDPDQTTLVDFPVGAPTTSVSGDFVTFFAGATALYKWERGSWSLGYRRYQDASGGTGSTSITDSVTFETGYRFNRATTISFLTGWSRRNLQSVESLGVVTAVVSAETSDAGSPLAEAGPLSLLMFDRDQEIDLVRVVATAAHQLTENLKLTGQFIYTTQRDDVRRDDGTSIVESSKRFNRYVGRIIVKYEFDSFRF